MLIRETLFVTAFGLTQIPLIFFVNPRVVRLDDEGAEIVIPLGYRTKNHWGSMYFGALATGADVAGGLNAAMLIRSAKYKGLQLIFKDFQAEFHKRADGDVHFITRDGATIREAMDKALETSTRVTIPVAIEATVPSKYGSEPVASFRIGLSLKAKTRGAETDNSLLGNALRRGRETLGRFTKNV